MTLKAGLFRKVDELLPGVWNLPGTVAHFDAIIDAWQATQKQGEPVDNVSFERAATNHLRREEGVRHSAYQDHLGFWTIGVGRLIDSRKGGRITADEDAILMRNDPSRRGKKWREYVLTDEEVDMLLANDIARFVDDLANLPAWHEVQDNVARKVALLSMAFQMGIAGLRGFRNSLGLVERGRYADAADNMLKSRWAQQTPARAKRVTDMIRTGRL